MQPQVNLSGAAATEEPFKGASLPDNRPAARDPTSFRALPSLREADPAQLEGGGGRKGSLWLSLKSIPEGRQEEAPSKHPPGLRVRPFIRFPFLQRRLLAKADRPESGRTETLRD